MSEPPPGRCDPALEQALRSLAPVDVRTGVRSIDPADLELLHPAEAAAIARAVPRRRFEFATGRALLRQLLGTSGPIPVGADRAPVLPAGVAASLAHDRTWAVAAVADRADLVLGIDIEPANPLAAGVAELILRPDEHGLDAHLAFTLKEAAYKAWSRAGGRFLGHHDVRLALGSSTFTAAVVDDGVHLAGRWTRVGDRWLALVVAPVPLRPGPPPAPASPPRRGSGRIH